MIMCTMKRLLHRSLYICTSYRITEAEHRALKMGESCFKICQILNSKQILLLIQVRIDKSRTSIRLKGGRGKILILPKLGVTTMPPPEKKFFTCLNFSFPDSTERIFLTDLTFSRPSLNAHSLTSSQASALIGHLAK